VRHTPTIAKHLDRLFEAGNADLLGVKRDTEKEGY